MPNIDKTARDLIIRNLHPAVPKDDIRKLFSDAGFPLQFCWVINKSREGVVYNHAFAFVVLENSKRKHEAVAALNGAILCGQPMRINLYRPRAQFHSPVHPTWHGSWQPSEAVR